MPRTTIRQAFSVPRRMPPFPARTSVRSLNPNLNAADADAVLRRGDTKELRRDLARARARVADLEAELRDRSRLDPRTRLLTLDAFRGDAEIALAHAARDGRPVALAVVDIAGFQGGDGRPGTG